MSILRCMSPNGSAAAEYRGNLLLRAEHNKHKELQYPSKKPRLVRVPRSSAAAAARSLAVACLALAAAAAAADGARILAVEPMASRSHWNFMSATLRALTDAGHNVTAFTPMPDGPRDRYAEVDVSAALPVRRDQDFAAVAADYGDPYAMADALVGFDRTVCDALHADPRFAATVRLLRDGRAADHYDAVVVEPLTVDCLSCLAGGGGGSADRLPVVYAIPSPMYTFAERSFTGHAANPACVPHLLARHAAPRTFAQRLGNAALLAYAAVRVAYDGRALAAARPRPYDTAPAVPPAVVFQNSRSHATETPRPVPHNVVDVGGVHLLRPANSVPQDILDFIEDSPHGVIFFTLGSLIKMSSLPKHVEKAFKEALSKVPQKVLWKYETEMTDMPKNVMIRKWFPQREILKHPKIKLFISHGGMSGVYEAIDAGVPVLGFPVFYDQPRNLEHLVDAGMAISLDLLNVSEDKISNAISELITNEKYMKNAKISSYRFKDQPMSPAQSVVYWTEYVIRHKGAPHLRSHAFDLTWYQYFPLDVIGAMLIFILMVLFITYNVFKCIYFCAFKSFNDNKVKTH